MAARGDELVVASLPEEQKKLVCVEFPGIVENDDKAVACLGGHSAISRAYFEKNERLEMRFRPEDQYCKPSIARANKTSNLLLKVKRRRIKTTKPKDSKSAEGDGEGIVEKRREGDKEAMEVGSSGVTAVKETAPDSAEGNGGQEEYKYSMELLGIVNTTYQFSGMTDFQVLPPGLNAVLHNRVPVDPKDFQIKQPVDESFADRDLPAFLPPEEFSKFDKPSVLVFTKRGMKGEEGSGKGFRKGSTYGLAFDYKGPIPSQPPHPDVLTGQFSTHPKLPQLKELFEERPVWSRLALQAKLRLNEAIVRHLLALVAYKFTGGPFKMMWVKFGYDPRTDPSSKVYQSLDIRVPKDITSVVRGSKIYSCRSRRSGYMDSKHGDVLAPKEDESTSFDPTYVEDTMYMYFPDRLPAQRQLNYQLCDIMDDQLQKIIHGNDGKEKECTEADGWCEENTYEKLRKTITAAMKALAATVKDEAKLDTETK